MKTGAISGSELRISGPIHIINICLVYRFTEGTLHLRNPLQSIAPKSNKAIVRATTRLMHVARILPAKLKDPALDGVVSRNDVLPALGTTIRHNDYLVGTQ